MRIALATAADWPDLSSDDHILAAAFARLGATATPATWTDPAVPWRDFDGVLIRSCWDYHLHPAAFRAWLARLEAEAVPLWNPPGVVRWNLEKTYLRDVEAAGVGIVPTVWVDGDPARELSHLMADRQWPRAVVKPVISASAHATWATTGDPAADDARFRAAASGGALMVQQFVEEVRTVGEWSLVFIAGAFSHAVLKRPAGDDFRVQPHLGGTHVRRSPDARLLTEAAAALAAAPGPTLYARVDGCDVGGRFLVMELELIEPLLFFADEPAAAERVAAEMLRASPSRKS